MFGHLRGLAAKDVQDEIDRVLKRKFFMQVPLHWRLFGSFWPPIVAFAAGMWPRI